VYTTEPWIFKSSQDNYVLLFFLFKILMNCMHCMLCVVRDVERVVEKLYGSITEPLILIGHRFVHSLHLSLT